MKEEFDKKFILVSGASSDIGTAIAKELADKGASLILHASRDESLELLKSQFDIEKHSFWIADFSKPYEIEASWKSLERSNKLDGFVHCVGMRSRRPMKLLKPDHVQQVMNVNFNSYLELVRLVTKRSQFNKGLSIVSISSIAAVSGGPGVTAYAASKAAMDAANRCLAKELHKKDIRINSIISGQVKTSAYNELIASKASGKDEVLDRQYMGLATTTDISEIALFLLSERSKFINGTSIHADGGYLS